MDKHYRWINRLNGADSVAALRADLQASNPTINPQQLTKLAILGAAEEGQRLVHVCDALGIQVVCICDDSPSKQGLSVGQHSIQPSSKLDDIDRNIPVIIASHRVLNAMQNLKAKGHTAVAPFALLQVLAPHKFPPHMFYENWLEALFENKENIQRLIKMLADKKSLAVLDAVIGFRLTLNPELLAPIIDWDLYGSLDILNLSDNETYVDGGTFDGDTIKSFIARVDGKFKKIYGFEPDTNTFKKLAKNFSHEPRVEPINQGLYSHSTTLYFDNAGTRGSILTDDANDSIAVPVTSIDEVLQGQTVTFVKMNIEGAEIPALKGAAKSIAQHKPKLGISAYHRAADLWEIPFVVQELHEGYKYYLRQHDGGVIETVVYAV